MSCTMGKALKGIKDTEDRLLTLEQEIDLVQFIKNYIHNRNGHLFNLYVSGSHLYGWSSKDSDIDFRGVYTSDIRNFLGLKGNKDVLHPRHIVTADDYRLSLKDIDLDIELFEIKKMIDLALQGNCNILEELSAEHIYNVPEFLKLRGLLLDAYGKNGLYGSYRGMARFNYRKYIRQGRNTTKKYLYVFRSLMAGIYALQTGRIEPNIIKLNKYFEDALVENLIDTKTNGLEKDLYKGTNADALDENIKTYMKSMEEAFIESKLPEKPSEKDVEKINKWLIDFRLEE